MRAVTKFEGTSKPLQWKIDYMIFMALQIPEDVISLKLKIVQQSVGLNDIFSRKKSLQIQRLKIWGFNWSTICPSLFGLTKFVLSLLA
jgi:hypothetical protein